ncbi:MAG: LPS-assembly protein LptD [Pseudomonadota bacterium]|nr:LPS-assembly protein LptD [Pseudomonadota bacterium]
MNWIRIFAALMMMAALVVSAVADDETADNPYRHLDWVTAADIAAMPEAQRPTYTGICEGVYLAPTMAQGDPTKARIEASADRFDTLPDGTNVLSGGVVLKQGNRELYSDEIRLNRITRATALEGNVKIRQEGMLILGDSAEVNLNEKKLDVKNTEYVIHNIHVHGTAGRIYNPDERVLVLDNSSYTTCEPGSEAWAIKADEIKLNEESGWGEVSGATVELGGVPVVYLPWWTFPIDDRRQSGFLFPSIGSGENGLDISTPYYLNLAPNYDATLTPRYLADRGEMLEGEFRYLSDHTSGDFGVGYMPDDQEFGDRRTLVTWHHNGLYDQKWESGVDYTRVSDSDYFLDLDTTLNTSADTHLDQRADLRYYGDTWISSVEVKQYQTIDDLIDDEDLPYRMLPQLRTVGRFPISDNRIQFQLGGEYTYFDHPEEIVDGPTDADRVRAIPSVLYNYRRPWGFVVPKLALVSRYYDLNQTGLDDNEATVENSIFSLDSGLYLDRPFDFQGTHFLQTLEPRVFYLYAPYKEQNDLPLFDTAKTSFSYEQLFRENRFTGGDRIGDANQISVGLTSRLINQDTGAEQINVSLGQIFYLRDREVQLTETDPVEETTLSPFVGRMNWLINQNWSWRAEAQIDTQENNLDNLITGFRYRDRFNNLVNLSFNYYDSGAVIADPESESIKQSDFSFLWSISQRWGIIGRWGFDLEQQRSYDNILGFEYESCCWRARVVNRRYLKESNDADQVVEASQGIYFQFELKGLGGLGGAVDRMLDDAISGYREREAARPTNFN